MAIARGPGVLVATCLACAAAVPMAARQGVQFIQSPAAVGVFVPDVVAIRTGAAVMTLALPDGRLATVELLVHEDRGSGDALWRGRVVGQPESQALFTLRSGFVAGSIHGFGALYQVTPRGGVHVLERVDPALRLHDQVFEVAPPAGSAPGADRAPLPDPQAAGDAEIDVLALYRGTTRDPALEATIQGWVDYANTVFVNSLVAARYRLLDARPFESPVPLSDHISQGLRPDVQPLRDWYGADVVSFVVPTSEILGLCACDGITPNANIILGPNLQFSLHVTHVGSLLSTWAHEGGHVLGMNHQPGESQNQIPFVPGAFGHFEPGGLGFGTVMSYVGTTIPHFSNPDVLYLGSPTGIAGQRDNANAARVNAPLIAAFRAPGPLNIPPAPSGLNFRVTSPGGLQIAISGAWFPSEAQTYDIERGTDGVTFAPWGTSTTNGFLDTAVSPGTTYHYRTRGTNYRGPGPWSAVATVAVPATPTAPTNLVAAAAGSDGVQLGWTDTSSTETRFVIEINAAVFDSSLGWEPIDEAPANATSFVVRPLPAATTMEFRVRAAVDVVVSAPSNVASATTLAAPVTPVLTSTSPASPGTSLTPTLNGSAPGATNVQIFVGTCAGVPLSTVSVVAGSFHAPVTVSPASTTGFVARALDANGVTSACSIAITYVHHAVGPVDQTGTLNGAPYRIVVPLAWNGTLLVFGHGYRDAADHPGEVADRTPAVAPNAAMMTTLLGQGYALAGSAYRGNGWAVEEGRQDLRALVQHFRDTLAVPTRTILWAFSMSSVIGFGEAEDPGSPFDAVLCGCAVGAGASASWDGSGDLALAYDAVFGMPSTWGTFADVRDDLDFETEVQPKLAAELGVAANFAKFEFLRLVSGVPGRGLTPPPPPNFHPSWALTDFYFAFEARSELERRAGGPIVQNLDRHYTLTTAEFTYLAGLGLPRHTIDTWLATMNARRTAAAPAAARQYLASHADYDGALVRPVLAMHTTLDPLVTVAQQHAYAARVQAAQRAPWLVQVYTNGNGHCSFTGPQLLAALAGVDVWAATGTPPDAADFPAASGFVPGFQPPPMSQPATAPATVQPPAGVRVAEVRSDRVTIRWDRPPVGPAPTGYLVEAGGASGQTVVTLASPVPVLEVAAPPGIYFVRVRAFGTGGPSAPSNEVRVVVNAPVAPSAPDLLTGTANGSLIELSWRNTYAGGEPTQLVLDVTGSIQTSLSLPLSDRLSLSGVPAGTYTLALRAANAAGASAPSAPITLTFPGICLPTSQPPTGVRASVVGSLLQIAWDPPGAGGAATAYLLRSSGAFVGTLAVGATRTLAANVPPGTYVLSVAAVNSCGTSAFSEALTIVVP